MTSVYSVSLAIMAIIVIGLIVVVYDEIDEAVTALVVRCRRRRQWRTARRAMLRTRHRR